METNDFRYFEFGEFKLDSRRRILEKNGGQIIISAKNFDLLFELVKNEGRILTHDELLNTVWEGTFVEQSNLKKGISALRHILGETPDSSLYIKTIPRKGYCFVSPVQTYSDEKETGSIHITATEIIIEEEIIEDDERHISIPKSPPQLAGKQPAFWQKFKFPILIGLAVLSIFALGFWFWNIPRKPGLFDTLKLENLKPQRLSTNGDVHESTLSSDGKFFVYALLGNDGKQSLWLRRIGALNALNLVPPTNIDFRSITVSPDNDSVFYGVTVEKSKDVLYQIPILGGTPRRILEDISSTPTFSSDGKKIAFLRDTPSVGRSLLIYNLETGQEESEIYSVKGDNHGIIAPRFSPDGKKFAFISSEKNSEGRTWTLNEISAGGGKLRQIITPRKGKIYDFEWLGDGSGLIMSADLNDVRQSQLFKISYPNGDIQRLTNDLFDYISVNLSSDGKSILTNQEERKADLWIADFNKPGDAVQLTRNLNLPYRFAVLPDGNILAELVENGSQSLSLINSNGTNTLPFIQQPNIDRFPNVSPDGKSVVFVSRRSGADQIWLADITGGNLRKITDEKNFVANPKFSPDGQSIYFEQYSETRFQITKMPKDGGEISLISPEESNNFDFSPDGKLLVFGFFDSQTKKWKTSLRNLADNFQIKTFDTANSTFLRFTPDGKGFIYNVSDIFRDGGNVWMQPLDGTPAKPYLELKNERVYWGGFSADGKKFIFSRGRTNSSAVLLSNELSK